MTVAEHVALARRFGPLYVMPFTRAMTQLITSISRTGFANDEEHPELVRLKSSATQPMAADTWHSDFSFCEEPAMGAILACRIAPAFGGDTLWADMGAAYQALDEATRSHVSGLTAIHDWHDTRDMLRRRGAPEEMLAAVAKDFPPVEHPVVRTHPVSGEKLLYVNQLNTLAIKGMREDESRALLKRLYRLVMDPNRQVRFRWRANSVAIWDNQSTQHCVLTDFFPQERVMERVSMPGGRPF